MASLAFEEINEDLKMFLSERSRNHSDDSMDVNPETFSTAAVAPKRSHPVSEDSDNG